MRVLITYGWCRTAYVMAESLCRAGFTVSACGDSALSVARVSRHVTSFDTVPDPFGDPRSYTAAVGDVMRRRGASLVFPAHEDFVVLQQFRDLLPADAIVAAPGYAAVSRRWTSGRWLSGPGARMCLCPALTRRVLWMRPITSWRISSILPSSSPVVATAAKGYG